MDSKDSLAGDPNLSGSFGRNARTSSISERSKAEELVGKRVRIRAVKALGSARLLNGLTGTVVAAHPIASGWVKLDLDENSRTPHRDWSVAVDRLVLIVSDYSETS
jgi:hypothetical protein